MRLHEALDMMLGHYVVWYWDNNKICCSAIDYIDKDGIITLANAEDADAEDLFATELELVKKRHADLEIRIKELNELKKLDEM